MSRRPTTHRDVKRRTSKKKQPNPINLSREISRARKSRPVHIEKAAGILDAMPPQITISPRDYCIHAARARLHLGRGLLLDGELVEVPLRVLPRYPAHTPESLNRRVRRSDSSRPPRLDLGLIPPILAPWGAAWYRLINPEVLITRWPAMPNTRVLAFVLTEPKRMSPQMMELIHFCAMQAPLLDRCSQGDALKAYEKLLHENSDRDLFSMLIKMTGRSKTIGNVRRLAASFVATFDVRSRSFKSRRRQGS